MEIAIDNPFQVAVLDEFTALGIIVMEGVG
jgi:hypothetical protein